MNKKQLFIAAVVTALSVSSVYASNITGVTGVGGNGTSGTFNITPETVNADTLQLSKI